MKKRKTCVCHSWPPGARRIGGHHPLCYGFPPGNAQRLADALTAALKDAPRFRVTCDDNADTLGVQLVVDDGVTIAALATAFAALAERLRHIEKSRARNTPNTQTG